MKNVRCACATLAFCLVFVQSVSAAERLGKAVSAKPSVSSAGSKGSKTLRPGDPIFFMDKLSTNSTGVGEFLFDDGTKLAVGPSASLTVDRFVQKGGSRAAKLGVSATKGAFRLITGSGASSTIRIKTPRGTMGVRG
jgi:hypothetical protein